MKLEFMADGSPECPLIRLYAFDQSAVLQLRDLVNLLAAGKETSASLHKQPWIESVDGCELELSLGQRDRGVLEVDPSRFECVLSCEGWADIAGLLEPFSESDGPELYQWLNEKGKISLLISSSGRW